MNTQQARLKIEERVEECLQIGEKFFDIKIERPESIILKSNGTKGGHSNYRKLELMFQIELFKNNVDHYLDDIIPHEVAHYVQRAYYGYYRGGTKVQPHGREWKYIMQTVFGLEPNRTHSMDTSSIKKRRIERFEIICSCGVEMGVTKNMTKKILIDQNRICAKCNTKLTLKSFTPTKEFVAYAATLVPVSGNLLKQEYTSPF